MNHEQQDPELQRLAPTLHSLPKRDPFLVEAGLFDHLPHAAKTAAQSSGGRPGTLPRWRWAMVGMAVAVLCATTWWALHPGTAAEQPTAEVSIPMLTDSEMVALAHDPSELITEDVAVVVWDTVPVTLTQDELLAYIDHEDLDLHDVITFIE